MAYSDITRDGVEFIGGDLQIQVSTETGTHGDIRRMWRGPRPGAPGWEQGSGVVEYAYLNGEALGPTAGDYPVLATPRECYWMGADLRTMHWVDPHSGVRGQMAITDEFPDGTSQGFAYYDENYNAVFMDTVLQHRRPLDRRVRHEGWSAGLDPDFDRILVEEPNGTVWVIADGYTPTGPRLRVINGEPVVMLSNHSRTRVDWSERQPYTRPNPEPEPEPHVPAPPIDGPMVVPFFARQQHPIEVMVADPYAADWPWDLDFYGDFQSWAEAETDPNTRDAIFYTDHRVPHDRMIHHAKQVLAQGRRKVFLSWNCYHDAILTDDEVADQIEDGFDTALNAGPGFEWLPWLGLFRGPRFNANLDWEFAWSGQEALETTAFAWQECVLNPQVTKVFVWALRRPEHDPIDGVQVTPEFQQAVDLMRRAPIVVIPPPPPPPSENWFQRFLRFLRELFT